MARSLGLQLCNGITQHAGKMLRPRKCKAWDPYQCYRAQLHQISARPNRHGRWIQGTADAKSELGVPHGAGQKYAAPSVCQACEQAAGPLYLLDQ